MSLKSRKIRKEYRYENPACVRRGVEKTQRHLISVDTQTHAEIKADDETKKKMTTQDLETRRGSLQKRRPLQQLQPPSFRRRKRGRRRIVPRPSQTSTIFSLRSSDCYYRLAAIHCLLFTMVSGTISAFVETMPDTRHNNFPASSVLSSYGGVRGIKGRIVYSGSSDRSLISLNVVEVPNSDATWTIPPDPLIVKSAIPWAAKKVAQDYAPAAAALFNNMKLPAAVVTAGMISLGFATRFPELPPDSSERVYSPELRKRCDFLERMHIVVSLLSITSELIVVLFAAVAVNQLTERAYLPTLSVWDLIQRDADLAWSAVNSHFVLGIIGFVAMLWMRAYVLLLAAQASNQLIYASASGTIAALCLMISIVNRGVEAGGGGETTRYGNTIIDLFQHYLVLLYQTAIESSSPGPLEGGAIVFEMISVIFAAQVLFLQKDKIEYDLNPEEDCPVIDCDNDDDDDDCDVENDITTTAGGKLIVNGKVSSSSSGSSVSFEYEDLMAGYEDLMADLTPKEKERLQLCLAIQKEKRLQKAKGMLEPYKILEEIEDDEREQNEKRRRDDSGDSSANIV